MSTQSVNSLEQQSFLTPQEVADLLRVSADTVRRWVNAGRLPAYKVGRGLRIKRIDFDRWLSEQQVNTAAGNQTDHSTQI